MAESCFLPSNTPGDSTNNGNLDDQTVGQDVYIAVIGSSGAGKSTFINLATESNLGVSAGLESCTKELQVSKPLEQGNRRVWLVDTPGFDDSYRSDADVLCELANFLALQYHRGRLFSGVLYLHRISDVRMGGTSKRNFDMFQKLCGTAFFPNVVLLSTMWSKSPTAAEIARETELKSKDAFFKPVLDNGGLFLRHDGTKESAYSVLAQIIQLDPRPLLIQSELVDQRLAISNTSAAMELRKDLMEAVRRHEEQIQALIEDFEDGEEGEDFTDSMKRETEDLRQKIAVLQDESKKLSKPMQPSSWIGANAEQSWPSEPAESQSPAWQHERTPEVHGIPQQLCHVDGDCVLPRMLTRYKSKLESRGGAIDLLEEFRKEPHIFEQPSAKYSPQPYRITVDQGYLLREKVAQKTSSNTSYDQCATDFSDPDAEWSTTWSLGTPSNAFQLSNDDLNPFCSPTQGSPFDLDVEKAAKDNASHRDNLTMATTGSHLWTSLQALNEEGGHTSSQILSEPQESCPFRTSEQDKYSVIPVEISQASRVFEGAPSYPMGSGICTPGPWLQIYSDTPSCQTQKADVNVISYTRNGSNRIGSEAATCNHQKDFQVLRNRIELQSVEVEELKRAVAGQSCVEGMAHGSGVAILNIPLARTPSMF